MVGDTEMTTGDAARILAVSPRQVRRLVEGGELAAAGQVGRSLLVDSASVHRLAQAGSTRGRPWNESSAWAAIELVETGRTRLMTASQRSRLRAKIRTMDAEQFVRNARRRAVVERYRVPASLVPSLRQGMAVTGASAVAAEPKVAERFGLSAGEESVLDGYVDEASAEEIRATGFLTPDVSGNVILRTTGVVRLSDAVVCDVLVAVDLAESLDPRSRSAGLTYLRRRLGSL